MRKLPQPVDWFVWGQRGLFAVDSKFMYTLRPIGHLDLYVSKAQTCHIQNGSQLSLQAWLPSLPVSAAGTPSTSVLTPQVWELLRLFLFLILPSESSTCPVLSASLDLYWKSPFWRRLFWSLCLKLHPPRHFTLPSTAFFLSLVITTVCYRARFTDLSFLLSVSPTRMKTPWVSVLFFVLSLLCAQDLK